MSRLKLTILILVLLSTGFYLFAAYPSPEDDYVNDFAGVIDKNDKDRIREKFEDLERQTGIEAVVVTINSIDNYDTYEKTIEAFATRLFNHWGVGHKKENNGFLILVSVKDRKCRIELGGGYGGEYDAAMKEVIDNEMIPHFKNDDYSRGIYEGSRAAVDRVTKKVSWFSYHKWHLLIFVLIVLCILAGISCMKSGKKGWGWAFFIAAGVLIIFLIKALMSGKSSGGFGGGSSFGGGASGSW